MREIILIPAVIAVVSILSVGGHAAAGCAPDTMWMRAYGAGGEYMMAVHNTADGGFIMGGNTTTYGAGGNDFWVVKIDAWGDTMWTRTYGTSGEEDLYDLRVVPAGGYIMSGSKRGELSLNTDIWVIRTNDLGDTLWTWTYGSQVNHEWAGSVQPMANGHFAVAATIETGSSGPTDIALYLLDSGGSHYDSEYFGGVDDELAMRIRQTSDDGFIIAGWTRSYGLGPDDFYLVKTDDTGDLDWEKWYGGAGADEGRDAIITSDGGYLLVGNTSSYGAGGADFYIIKTNSAGDTLWTRTVGGTDYDIADGVVEGTDGTIVVVGETESYGSGDMSVYVAALGGGGAIYCTDTYGTDGRDDGVAIVETPDQGFVIVGGTAPAGTFDWSGLALRVYGQAPLIHSITDVPNDQGRAVRVVWGRSSHDVPDGSPQITSYSIYRRYDFPAFKAGGVSIEDFPRLGYPPGSWDCVDTVPARNESVYSVVVPTLCDSTVAEGMCWSAFFVSALTAEPSFYFDSPVDSGYSVDNLEPSPPTGLHMASATSVSWDAAPEADSDYFTVYGSADGDFGSAVLVGYTIDVVMDVSADIHAFYHVTATDFSGNEGDPATVENTFAGVNGGPVPATYALRQNEPNPFHAATAVSFDMPSPGRVILEVIDVNGRVVRTLVNGTVSAGVHSVIWGGRDAAGCEVGSGIYFIRMETGGYGAARKMLLVR